MNQELQEKLLNACREVINNVCTSDTNLQKPTVDNCASDVTLQIRIQNSKTGDNALSKDNFSIEFLNCPNVPALQHPDNIHSDSPFEGEFPSKDKKASRKVSVKDLTCWFNQKKFKNEFNKKIDDLNAPDSKYLKMLHFSPSTSQSSKSIQTEDFFTLISNRLAVLPEEVLKSACNFLSRSENLTNYEGATNDASQHHENIVVSINFSNTIKLMTLFLAINTIVLLKFILWEQLSGSFL